MLPSVLALVAGSRAFPIDTETVSPACGARIPPAAARQRARRGTTGLDASQDSQGRREHRALPRRQAPCFEDVPRPRRQLWLETKISGVGYPRQQMCAEAYLAQHLSADAQRPLLDELFETSHTGLPVDDESTEALASLAAHFAPEGSPALCWRQPQPVRRGTQ